MTERPADAPLDALVELCRSAKESLTLVAPFAKAPVLAHLLAETPERTPVRLITRWRLDECLAGVSDIDCWTVLQGRGSAEMYLVDRLHAKVYANERQGLVGSANLTWAALRGGTNGNIEVQTSLGSNSEEIRSVFRRAMAEAIPVTEALFELFNEALAEVQAGGPSHPTLDIAWRPSYRRPDEIFSVARGALSAVETDVKAARGELARLGLDVSSDEAQVSIRLLEMPLTRDLIAFLHQPGGRRFGEISAWYEERYGASAVETQTLYRWIRQFLGAVILYERPRHSEVLKLRS